MLLHIPPGLLLLKYDDPIYFAVARPEGAAPTIAMRLLMSGLNGVIFELTRTLQYEKSNHEKTITKPIRMIRYSMQSNLEI